MTTFNRALTWCIFVFEDSPPFRGFTDGSVWNGYDNVWVEPEMHARICDYFRRLGPDELDEDFANLKPGPDGLVSYAYGFIARVVEEPRRNSLLPKTCAICKREFVGWGNNAWPVVNHGICCDHCNYESVIPARLRMNR